MKYVLLTLFLSGCAVYPNAEVQPNTVLCLFSSCSLQAEDAISGSIEGDSEQDAVDTATPTLELPGL